MKSFLNIFGRNVVKCFSPKNLIFHIIAILATIVFVKSGFDWYYFLNTRNPIIFYSFFPAVMLGGILPIIIPLILLIFGKISRKRNIFISGIAMTQSVMIGSFISSLYKSFTGRIQPTFFNTSIDISRQFNFGFLEHGIFWGWPSSHTTIAFAMVVTFVILFPKSNLIKLLAILYAFYIGFGVSISIHWFSDFIAGALLGIVVGKVVGNHYRFKEDN